jgi:hypothetical protein
MYSLNHVQMVARRYPLVAHANAAARRLAPGFVVRGTRYRRRARMGGRDTEAIETGADVKGEGQIE